VIQHAVIFNEIQNYYIKLHTIPDSFQVAKNLHQFPIFNALTKKLNLWISSVLEEVDFFLALAKQQWMVYMQYLKADSRE
jgi:hypothetical protein